MVNSLTEADFFGYKAKITQKLTVFGMKIEWPNKPKMKKRNIKIKVNLIFLISVNFFFSIKKANRV